VKSPQSVEKLLSLATADGPGVNVNESERERSGIICGNFVASSDEGQFFEVPMSVNDLTPTLPPKTESQQPILLLTERATKIADPIPIRHAVWQDNQRGVLLSHVAR
jgi:hypothetical protein